MSKKDGEKEAVYRTQFLGNKLFVIMQPPVPMAQGSQCLGHLGGAQDPGDYFI